MTKHFWIGLLVAIYLLASGWSQAQETGEAPLDERLLVQIDELESYTAALRELEELEIVELRFPSRDEVRAYIETSFRESLTPDILAEQDAFYKGFGFVPADYDLLQEIINLYGEQVAGYYDTITQEMNVILFSGDTPSSRLPILEQIIYVHEYVHALQDQHFDLDAYTTRIENEENSDLVLAQMALVEGDAAAIMNEYTRRAAQANPLGVLLGVALGGIRAGNLTLPAGTPAVIGAELLFPYQQGEVFVRALYRDGGWSAVNAAYTNPPRSTEHILHPERYQQQDMPVSVALTDQSTALGADWSLAISGVFGEFYLRQWLLGGTRAGLDRADYEAAAAGWGGDAYHVYRSASGELAWVLVLVWDQGEADEFHAALDTQAQQRYGAAAASDSIACYSGAQVLCVLIEADRTTLVQAQSEAQARALLSGIAD